MAVEASEVAIAPPVINEPVRDHFREAFNAAVKTHSEPVVEEPEPEPDPDPDIEPAEPVAKVAKPVEPVAKTTPAAPATETGLVTDEEFTALQTKHKDDPAALRKSLEAAFTQKTQKLSEQKRSYERVVGYLPMIEALEADPAGTLRQIAKDNGIDLTPPPVAETPDPSSTATEVLTEFKAALGPELDYLAESLAPAVTKLVERLTQRTVEQSVKPLREQNKMIVDRFSGEQTEALMKTFRESHADYDEQAPAMYELAQKLTPGKTMTELEYLDHLYNAVTRTKWDADREANIEREASGRFKKRVAKMETAETEPQTASTPDAQVRKRPDGPVDFHQAFKDAKAGIRYDD